MLPCKESHLHKYLWIPKNARGERFTSFLYWSHVILLYLIISVRVRMWNNWSLVCSTRRNKSNDILFDRHPTQMIFDYIPISSISSQQFQLLQFGAENKLGKKRIDLWRSWQWSWVIGWIVSLFLLRSAIGCPFQISISIGQGEREVLQSIVNVKNTIYL